MKANVSGLGDGVASKKVFVSLIKEIDGIAPSLFPPSLEYACDAWSYAAVL